MLLNQGDTIEANILIGDYPKDSVTPSFTYRQSYDIDKSVSVTARIVGVKEITGLSKKKSASWSDYLAVTLFVILGFFVFYLNAVLRVYA
jgi:hypothetical protein